MSHVDLRLYLIAKRLPPMAARVTGGDVVKALRLWETYTRQEAHAIFSPDTTFTPQTGTWGLQGIVPLADRPGSYVFFVTFGRKQGDHSFDESITTDGVLTWQSQPKQRLDEPRIRAFIEHDDRVDTIYLFLRVQADAPYYYCGALGYLSHDTTREQPVHFQWQLLDWPAPDAVQQELRTRGVAESAPTPSEPRQQRGTLLKVEPPPPSKPRGRSTAEFRAIKRPWHPDKDARDAALGLAGELLVLRRERLALEEAALHHLASKVTHVSVVEGDGAGYDIRSFHRDGRVRYIEVKTTRGSASTAFYVSPNEVKFSERHPDEFVLVRVHNYDSDSDCGLMYEIPGPIRDSFALEITEFRATRSVGTAE